MLCGLIAGVAPNLIGVGDKGLYDKDASAVVGTFVPNAVIFDLAPPLAQTPDREGLATWLDTWQGPVERETRDLEVSVSGDLAFCHGFYRISATTRGRDRAVFWTRATTCLKRVDGAWRIVHEHTSVPFYMDGSFRAATDLEP